MKKLYLNVQYFRFFKTFFFILFNIKIKFVAVFKRSENMGTCYATVMADVCIWPYVYSSSGRTLLKVARDSLF